MRSALAVLLVALLAICPIACGTAHALSGEDGANAHAHDRGGHPGLPAPANDDDCVCNGAVKAADAWAGVALGHSAPSLDMPSLPPLLDAPPLLPASSGGLSAADPRRDDLRAGALRPVLRC